MILPRSWIALVLFFSCLGAIAAPLPSVDQFFRPHDLSGAQLSPNGRLLALQVGSKTKPPVLAVLDLATMKSQVVASFASAGVARFEWVNDTRLVFNLTVELTGPGMIEFGSGLFAVNHDGSGFRQLAQTTYHSGGALPPQSVLLGAIGARTSDEVHVITPGQFGPKQIGMIGLSRVNTVTGRVTDVATPADSVHWVIDASGEVRAVMTAKGNSGAIVYRDRSGNWGKVQEFDTFVGKAIAPMYVDPQGIMYVRAGADKAAVYTYDPVKGKMGSRPVLVSDQFDIEPEFVSDEKKLLGIRYTIDAEVTAWIDSDAKAVQVQVDDLLPATVNRISFPLRSQGRFVLVESFSDMQPNEFHLFETVTKRLSRLGSVIPPIHREALGVMDMVRYKARDGREIPSYLTLPPGPVKKDLPMVVLVHGGPWLRGSSWRWDAQVQFLASRGYAVLQPEFRGSTGFGTGHFEAGWKQWGLAMQNDLADGARWAIDQGIADPQRICIAGFSYGGYAALMGDAARLTAASPLQNAARLTQPLLLAYGAWDVRVPIEHGEKLRKAVKGHNQQLEWVEYDNEGHGWSKPENQVDFWSRVERFLARSLARNKPGINPR